MNYDAIIIGGGLGGLTAGAKLAKAGKRVLLIEQHSAPGGYATTFQRKDLTMEVSLHTMSTNNSTVRPLFDDLNLYDGVDFVKIPDFYRFVNGRYDILFPADISEYEAVLIRHFPSEATGIRKFIRIWGAVQKEFESLFARNWLSYVKMAFFPLGFPALFFNFRKNVGQFIDSLIKNEDLKLILLATHMYYHHDPYRLSLLYYAMGQASVFLDGGYYIKGGSQKLSDHLAALIKENGGELRYLSQVTRIISRNGRAIGVEFHSKRSGPDTTPKQAFADQVICNAPIPQVFNQLLTPDVGCGQIAKINHQELAPAISALYLGFSKPVREIGGLGYTTFVVDPELARARDIGAFNRADFQRRSFIFTDYSQIDSGLASPGKSVGVICWIDDIQAWQNLSSVEYQSKKEAVARIFIERLNGLIPGVKDYIEYYETATPVTNERYTLNPRGTGYGFAHTPGQFLNSLKVLKPPLKNLHFASAWTFIGAGYLCSILSGYLCATKILNNE